MVSLQISPTIGSPLNLLSTLFSVETHLVKNLDTKSDQQIISLRPKKSCLFFL